MIRPLKMHDSQSFVPQAILALPIDHFRGSFGDYVVEGYDDLDHYQAIEFVINGSFHVSLRNYHGHPEDTVTLYIDSRVPGIEHYQEHTECVHK